MSTALAIETYQLSKRFGARLAVSDLTLSVPRGEVFAFLGPNGAGKSTSVKMLLGLVTPTGGQAMVLGKRPNDPAARTRIGFLPEHFRFHPWLQATELLELHARLYGMRRETSRQRIREVLDLVGLTEHATRAIAGFSKGMLQRVGLAQALLNEPELVFLDEPTSALDPFGRILVRNVIRQLRAQGTTVFLNSHLLGEVEATCDRAAFINNGQVLRSISMSDLGEEKTEVRLQIDALSPDLLAALRTLTQGQVSHESTHSGRIALTLELPDDTQLPALAALILSHDAQLYAMVPRRMSLEQLFLDIIGTQDSGQ